MEKSAVLIVDSDQEFRYFVNAALRVEGHEVVDALSAAEACALLGERRFSLILADLGVRGGNASEILQTAREQDPTVVVVALTANGSVSSALEALRLGAHDYLLKPCSTEALLAAIHRGLEHHQVKRALVQKTSEIESLQKQLDEHSRLIQNVGHELKNPLTVVCGYSSILLDSHQEAEPAELARNLASIHRNAEHMGSLVNEMLESARLSGKKIDLDRASHDAAKLAREAVDNMQFQATAKELTLSCQAASGLTVQADLKRVRQIFANLIGNAIKFTPEGGMITVAVEADKGFARFCVADTGVGVSAEELPRLFERFYQVEETRGRHAGLGLGLDICKSLVELHGGRIWAESLKGYGSKFYFTLPLSARPAARVSETPVRSS